MRALLNAAYDPAAVPAPSGEAPAFHRALPGYAPTPVRDLGGGVFVKDESSRFGLPAFKILGVTWALERALRADPTVKAVTAASAGNHGRAVAHAAAERGLYCRIFVPERSAPARRAAIAAEGADVVVVDGTYEDAVQRAQRYAYEGPYVLELADVGSSDAAGAVIDGYATLFAELADDYDTLIVPVGVGSLGAAAARWGAQTDTAVIAVEPATAACLTAALDAGRAVTVDTPGTSMAGLDCAAVSARAWDTLHAGVRATVTVTDEEAHAAMRELAADGYAIGDCGAASLAALHVLRTDPACARVRETVALDRVLLVATEGVTDPDSYRVTVGS
ncbi:MAG TPA: pyridoxal-phosphate dependent enzyme [Solirubrobacter sp.]|nr:pyridoxal-phosphate dependent enzyme [Solirubrobacter sp.]